MDAGADAGGERFVATAAICDAVRSREGEVLDAVGIDWLRGRPRVQCADRDPSWRWDERRCRAHCA